MDAPTTIAHTQVIQGDGLKLAPGKVYDVGIQYELFPQARTGRTSGGEKYEVPLDKVDVVIMNPPFTKVERGIRRFVDMGRYQVRVGGEVGLWGHFIALSNEFLLSEGKWGGVIPINVLRGRESAKVRRLLFNEWTPLYILKPTRNYAFSEWSEYRDILFVAAKKPPAPDHQVRFALVKANLTQLTETEVADIVEKVKTQNRLRSDNLDINSYSLAEINERFNNLMWFCGGIDLNSRDGLTDFIGKTNVKLTKFPEAYFREGYRPVPKGVSEFLFVTRHLNDARVEEANLEFEVETESHVEAQSKSGVTYWIEQSALLPSLRTAVGLSTMNITGRYDYIAQQPYRELKRVLGAVRRFDTSQKLDSRFWSNLHEELGRVCKLCERA
jgi:hypothetical protein